VQGAIEDVLERGGRQGNEDVKWKRRRRKDSGSATRTKVHGDGTEPLHRIADRKDA